jgi:hypothetical protein
MTGRLCGWSTRTSAGGTAPSSESEARQFIPQCLGCVTCIAGKQHPCRIPPSHLLLVVSEQSGRNYSRSQRRLGSELRSSSGSQGLVSQECTPLPGDTAAC